MISQNSNHQGKISLRYGQLDGKRRFGKFISVLNKLFGSLFANSAVSVCFETELVRFYRNFTRTLYCKMSYFFSKFELRN